MKRLPCYMVMIFILTPVIIQANTRLETPIVLPKTEGSKNFDLEISIANQNGINQYNSKSFSEARRYFKRAQSLAKQFRDPGLGIVSFNLGLALHKLNLHENAVKAFLIAISIFINLIYLNFPLVLLEIMLQSFHQIPLPLKIHQAYVR